jgi:hypothetical protein
MPRQPALEFADRWVSQKPVADILEISEVAIEADRCYGTLGIPYHRFGKRIRYRLSEVVEWAEQRRVVPPGHQQEKPAAAE